MQRLIARADAWYRLIRMDRPIGTLLLLWPTLWGLWLAGGGSPEPRLIAIFVAGVVVMRAAGCIINDYADREVDPFVARTRARPLATGEVSPREALALFAGLMLVALFLLLQLDWRTIGLGVVGALLTATYPFLKRYTHLPQFYLGMAFSWAIPMAFTAHGQPLAAGVWLLLAGNLLWVVAYDTQYALVDRDDDLKLGVKSTAILFGRHDRWLIAVIQAGALALLAAAGMWFHLDGYYFWALAIAAGFFAWQQVLVRDREPAACLGAFLNNTWVGAIVLGGIVLALL